MSEWALRMCLRWRDRLRRLARRQTQDTSNSSSLTGRLGVRPTFGNTGQDDRISIGELSHQIQASAQGFNGLPQSGNHQIGALFKLGNAVLPDAEFLGHRSEERRVGKECRSRW